MGLLLPPGKMQGKTVAVFLALLLGFKALERRRNISDRHPANGLEMGRRSLKRPDPARPGAACNVILDAVSQ